MTTEIIDQLPGMAAALTGLGVGGLVGYFLKGNRPTSEQLYEARNPAKNPDIFATIGKTEQGEKYIEVGEIGGGDMRCVRLFYKKSGRGYEGAFVPPKDSEREEDKRQEETLYGVIQRTLIGAPERRDIGKKFERRKNQEKFFRTLCSYQIPSLRTPQYLNCTTRYLTVKDPRADIERIYSYDNDPNDSVCQEIDRLLETDYDTSYISWTLKRAKALLFGLTTEKLKIAHEKLKKRSMTEVEYAKIKRTLGIKDE